MGIPTPFRKERAAFLLHLQVQEECRQIDEEGAQATHDESGSYNAPTARRRKSMTIATQLFGRSGHMSTRTIFGAASLSHVTQQEADRTLEILLQYGVNHLDLVSSYGDAELRIAPWLARYRSQFYVATKESSPGPTNEQMQALVARLGMVPLFV